MHAPDGFLNAGTAVATGALSAGTIGASLRRARARLMDKQVPLAGLAAAFIFAAQMFNFPVAAGTTGHLLGGALAAILLGPSVGSIVVAVVIVVQALAFADGGLTALGYNILDMAIVTSFGGYALFRGFRKLMPKTTGGVMAATGLSSALSVVLAAMTFSLLWLFGATAPVPFDKVFASMVGVHALIGIGEGVLSALAVGAVIASRPDLVYGIRDMDHSRLGERRPVKTRAFLLSGLAVALVLAVVVSQFAASAPDGLQKVAEDSGFAASAQGHAMGGSMFAHYATAGVANPTLSLAIAGAAGVVITLAVGAGILYAVRERRSEEPDLTQAVEG
jgi:cobalt/nickel transport system permease protein